MRPARRPTLTIFIAGQEMWVVGLDKNEAEESAVKLLAKKGYPTETNFDLIKVILRTSR